MDTFKRQRGGWISWCQKTQLELDKIVEPEN